MKLSTRLTTLTPDSDGWGVYYRAKAMIAAGTPVIELTIGEHDTPTDPAILDALHAAARAGHTGYASVPGTNALRDAIAARVTERTGVATARDNILVTAGGQAALLATHSAVCDPGDTALFIDPFYVTYPGTIRAVGAVPRAIAAMPEDGFQPRPGPIAAAAAGARSLLINSPHNPTGVIYSRDTLEGIAAVCRDQDLWLISDEVYDTQVWHGDHLSPRALPGMEDRTLAIGSMSKSHAMTGSRIGWIAGPEEAIDHLSNLSTHTTYGVPGYIQDAALFALEQGTAFERRIAEPFRRRRDLALSIVAKSNRIVPVPSGGAMYLMLDIRRTGQTGEGFANALLESEHIGVMPGESFGKCAAGHIRVALTVPDDQLTDALHRLVRFAEGLAHAA
ncbi:pyridoxal phosphate-dependent aminotransferase [Pseudoruegeria sp. HB172150]|uniref:pyridoxal phosphate-dependent aminotransferase n=1 Tax=Pseudoruegeria sp. HB172150 TaxID=2721164 RepID=UPI001556931C|nr:aminotransferase class I/II-fold pyridoxal phosphate-dependent enzyme [Pseudoruegeria sp. HB172150]